ncbi:MAG: hypothetical protein KDE32_11090 [Novosphingobium sp.]|nr:hypothetical protein [Novosphingobium sp.]
MLLRKIEKVLNQHEMPWTKFGRLAAHDPRFVADLRNGRTPRPHTARRIEQFVATYSEAAHAN